MQWISDALKHNNTLQELNILRTFLSIIYCQLINDFHSIVLDNRIGDDGMRFLRNVLFSNNTLHTVLISKPMARDALKE